MRSSDASLIMTLLSVLICQNADTEIGQTAWSAAVILFLIITVLRLIDRRLRRRLFTRS